MKLSITLLREHDRYEVRVPAFQESVLHSAFYAIPVSEQYLLVREVFEKDYVFMGEKNVLLESLIFGIAKSSEEAEEELFAGANLEAHAIGRKTHLPVFNLLLPQLFSSRQDQHI